MPEPKIARGIHYSMGTDGTLWFRVFDFAGAMIAIAPIPLEQAVILAEFIEEHVADEEENDHIGEVAGHA